MNGTARKCGSTCSCVDCQQAALQTLSPELQAEFAALFDKVKSVAQKASRKMKPYLTIAQIISNLVRTPVPPPGEPPRPVPVQLDQVGRYQALEEQRKLKERLEAAQQSRPGYKQKPEKESSLMMEIFQEMQIG